MKRIAVALVALLSIGTINFYAAFPTFVWTGEYRSRLYAVEMAEDDGVDDTAATTDSESITVSLVFDTVDDEPATPTDLDENESIPDEEMSDAADEDDPASVAQSITSYDIEPEIEEEIEPAIDAQEEDTEPGEEQQEG